MRSTKPDSYCAGQGYFRGGATTGTATADFDINHVTLASKAGGGSTSSFTARGGESLQQVARQVWGDSSLWYKLAEANGLSAGTVLSAGQTLHVPAGAISNTHNASSLQPYDPARAIGDLTPGTISPAPPAGKKGCGTFGIILLAVVAIAVAAVAGPALIGAASVSSTGAATGVTASGLTGLFGGATVAAGSFASVAAGVVGGAIAGAAGSIVSQGVGVATGIQDKFSWKSVGLAAIGGGVGGGLGNSGLFGHVDKAGEFVNGSLNIQSGIVDAGLRGAFSSALGQGIGVATGLQDSFSWAGVAAAGVGAAAAYGAGGKLQGLGKGGDNTIANHARHLGTKAASALANAATRSAIEGSNFGKNIKAAIPDVIGQAIGNALVNGVRTTSDRQRFERVIRSLTDDQSQINSMMERFSTFSKVHREAILSQGGNLSTEDAREALQSFVRAINTIDREFKAGRFASTGRYALHDDPLGGGMEWNDDLFVLSKEIPPWSQGQVAAWREYRETVGFQLASIDAYSETSDSSLLLDGYARLGDGAVDRLGFDSSRLIDNSSGYASALYSTPHGYYIYANRGTDNWVNLWSDDNPDTIANISSYLVGGRNAQYDLAVQNAIALTEINGLSVKFTGHSLGGGLAIAQAIATGGEAITFNHAPFHRATYNAYAGEQAGNAVIRSYRNSIDALRIPDGAQRFDDAQSLGGPAFDIWRGTEIIEGRQFFRRDPTIDVSDGEALSTWIFGSPVENSYGVAVDHSMTGMIASQYNTVYDRLNLGEWYDGRRR